ncbi:MAG TPA: hypothetical protein VJN18_11605 [Polyangiaceae bacterium]|nr:hypothetical protein [Polyangiaceae bacterium]
MLVSREDVLRAARMEVRRLMADGSLLVSSADIEAARPYLRRCVLNMTVYEVESITAEAAGALWARGAVGAARYRVEGGRRRKRGRRFKSLRTERQATDPGGDDDDD